MYVATGLGLRKKAAYSRETPTHQFKTANNRSGLIVYFKKQGIECLNEVVMGTEQLGMGSPILHLAPNPSNGLIHLSSAQPITNAEVWDVQGNQVMSALPDVEHDELDLRSLADGLYLVRLWFSGGGFVSRRVLIAH